MISIIKTAILTILISFASGLLLDYYKNLGSRILCNIRKGKPTDVESKEDCGYVITVKNPSNKTIHELTINIGSQTKLRSTDAKITRGLKFDSSVNDNTLEVYIPFISKGDEFSVTVYLENQDSKPVIVIKSPENFKEIYSGEENGILALLLNIPTNIKHLISKETKKSEEVPPVDKNDFTTVMSKVTGDEQTINKSNREVFPENKKLSKNKKKIIVAAIILVMIASVSGKVYSKVNSLKVATPTTKTEVQKQPSGTNSSTGESTENTSTKKSTGTTSTKKAVDKTDEATPTEESTDGKTVTTPAAGATDKTTGNTPAAGTGTKETTPAAGSGTTETAPAATDAGTKETIPAASSDTNTGTTPTTGGTTGN
ncbi:hypothetical protein KPL37_17310 [Clostridium frigoris]|uniref:Uncharacterized protein n=1 Tax=Clostridium frigoris TaxID=205327 RepID=A0ABS6BXY6_9CLOT|nr:hypothetical protein [Clostridium frigoris]MBU3161467.1 hypothetical protein [Clostridium frigoris]